MEIRLGANYLLFSKTSWDSELFGVDVYSLKSWLIVEDLHDIDAEAWLAATLKALGGKRAMLTGRLPANEDALRAVLVGINMSIVEWTLHPTLDLELLAPTANSEVSMRQASQDDLIWITKEARDAFKVSRFYRDALVPRNLAAERFEAWVESAFVDPEKEVLVFENRELQPLGFFIVSVAAGIAQLELTAISESMRGMGWSLPVWGAYLKHAKRIGLKSVRTNISAENSAVIGIYPKLGFKFSQSSVAMHGHYFQNTPNA